MSELNELPVYRDTLARHIAEIVDPGTEVVLHGLAPGSFGGVPPAELVHYPVQFHRVLGQVIGLYEQAEREGYDAIAIAGYSEAMLREARSAVDIPVAAMPEANLLVGCSMARKIGLVTISPLIGWRAEEIVRNHALGDRVAGIYALARAVNEFELTAAFDAPGEIIDLFRQAAATAIGQHADVIVPAEGVLNELLYTHGVRDIDGVSVMDSVGVAMVYTELLVKLRIRTGLHPGRQWEYRKCRSKR
jgi:allantoin racemase